MNFKYNFDGDNYEYEVEYWEIKERLAKDFAKENCYGGDKLWATLNDKQKDMLVSMLEHIIGECDLHEYYEEWLADDFEEKAYNQYLRDKGDDK